MNEFSRFHGLKSFQLLMIATCDTPTRAQFVCFLSELSVVLLLQHMTWRSIPFVPSSSFAEVSNTSWDTLRLHLMPKGPSLEVARGHEC